MAVARKRWSSTARLRIFLANDGRCHVCGQKISVGEGWDLDHRIALALGGDDEEHNLAPGSPQGVPRRQDGQGRRSGHREGQTPPDRPRRRLCTQAPHPVPWLRESSPSEEREPAVVEDLQSALQPLTGARCGIDHPYYSPRYRSTGC
jgi:hypothetical protein